jgi:predicted nucleic acid-binding Zn ribbon protein
MEKIPQHKHCTQCAKAFIGNERYCSTECKKAGEKMLKTRKRQLIILYVVTLVILTVAVLIMAM